jgi:hypothetical protein
LDVAVARIVEVRPVRPRHMEVIVAGTAASGQALRPNHEIFEGTFAAPDALPAGMMPSQAEIIRRVIGPL